MSAIRSGCEALTVSTRVGLTPCVPFLWQTSHGQPHAPKNTARIFRDIYTHPVKYNLNISTPSPRGEPTHNPNHRPGLSAFFPRFHKPPI
jgi:hypothetical protein|nr:MAG TPA: hypothetical protein [Caudoviricetes sp.]